MEEKGNNNAIILLHEIYGINQHIIDTCNYYNSKGFDVFCPNFIKREKPFDYSDQDTAYQFFKDYIGFDIYHEIIDRITSLKSSYSKVILMGFSIGATIAWICASKISCDGLIGYYGSRIRDYTNLTPLCPTLLIFASQDSFPVIPITETIKNIGNVDAVILDGNHGFLDKYSCNYSKTSSDQAVTLTDKYLAGWSNL